MTQTAANPTEPAQGESPEADTVIVPANHAGNEYLLSEIANLTQENVELHELIGAQRAEIERLQQQNRKLKVRLLGVAGYLRLMLAIYFDGVHQQPSKN